MANLREVFRQELSDGLVIVKEMGRRYYVTRTWHEDDAPDMYPDMSKGRAMEMAAMFIKADVLES